ncbi:RNA exonuclease 4-like isoform X2 [Olea europaea var. sylvestris]|uniref:RNA exonuclease 4-like isoform X1 n=1 Tax=Olea europaea var. sylvestris TaxID=158386 RepID=UPI000C1CFB13|nr:RNA exonuclease 4-like isoform X1 [Olea europaea var. sylvestris]XP_022873457.1 RNA exonuclease 4-like isoform X2 [Olea europaea var. sylvestris]
MDNRNKCAACYRQFNKMEHLVEHMRTSYHSAHEPMCGICRKHCRSFESLREHLIGPLPKVECERIFKEQGCDLCLTIFSSRNALHVHREACQFSRGNNMGLTNRMANLGIQDDLKMDSSRARVVALACKMVGGGSDGSLDLCARVCLIDESEKIIFHTYVKPRLPVTKYRYETTGMRPEFLRDAMPLRQVQRKIQDYLCNGEPIWQIRSRAGKARILVGHGLDHDLKSLEVEYPQMMRRDTADYPPLMKSSKLSNSLKYLTKTYLGYDIQTGIQDPYEDCVATMRLYMRMRSQRHKVEDYPLAQDPQNRNNFAAFRQSELERMAPEKMLEISRSDYYCWCLDSSS